MIIADNIAASDSLIKQIISNKYSNKYVKTDNSVNQFKEYLIPQPSVESQKISHYFYWNWTQHQNHNSTAFKRISLVCLDFRTKN